MSTIDIKLEILDKLKEVEDIALLNRIMNLLKNEKDQWFRPADVCTAPS